MSVNNQNSNQYSATDIQRYLRGDMTAEEMHAIETAALDDPFLADAIEGFEMSMTQGNEESVKSDLEKLNKQLAERVSHGRAKIVPINQSKWWQISAVAAAVVIVGLAVYNNWMKPDQQNESKLAAAEKQQNDTFNLQKPEEDKSPSTLVFSDTQKNQQKKLNTPSSGNPVAKNLPSPLSAISENETENKTNKQKVGAPVQEISRNDDLTKRENRGASAKAKEEIPGNPVVVDHNASERYADAVSPAPTETLSKKNNQLAEKLNSFSGRVVDPNNKPLPYATLQITPGKANLVTDQSGNFDFTNKDSVVDVQVALVGFEQRNFRLQSSISTNNLILEPYNQNLDEVVVSGYGEQRKKDASKTTVKVQDAVPEIGWVEYEKYLEKNKKPPANNPLMKGEVVVSFQVGSQSTLSDFKIEKSLSKDYDIEAVRLIQGGPSWKLLNSRKTRITVIVKF